MEKKQTKIIIIISHQKFRKKRLEEKKNSKIKKIFRLFFSKNSKRKSKNKFSTNECNKNGKIPSNNKGVLTVFIFILFVFQEKKVK